jgi:DNA invertase Pin-like site-specific DNA recombinase
VLASRGVAKTLVCATVQGTRVIAYTRLSREADNGIGLDVQREAIAAEAGRRGWQVVRWFEDDGYTAADTKRPGVKAALDTLESGEAEVLVIAKLDRLSRSLFDFADLMRRAQRQGWAVVALDFGMDTTTPQGEMVVNVLATFAQFERRLISQRTRDALAAKRRSGVRLGRPPSVSPEAAARVRELDDGRSLRAIARALDADGVPAPRGGRWYASSVSRVLRQEQTGRP